MKKPLMMAGLTSMMLLGACAMNDNNDNAAGGIYKENGNTINVRNREDLYNSNGRITSDNELMTRDRSDNFGYVRQQKSPIQGETVSYKNMYTIDRERTADAISKLSVGLPTVNDCSVLVTDEEVLIAYDTDAKTKKDRQEAADQVKKTAMSVVPRWYNIYVTDDVGLRRDIENIAPMGANVDGAQDTINRTIKLMTKSSPQGQVNDGMNKGNMK
ncbi:YhcN/YlaJ family sporulation lipoprotein [Bacillus sp. REN10]|uniref:YhcN/YlaJ family sporulation lipoprotein n=1 Tax=Bacillus sp. REN10 TaxID=2782541 RepID=UPI00193C4677|nr:YhcN/YlaJ family sporulation lipoprotein [Bacillus sp. REN10]